MLPSFSNPQPYPPLPATFSLCLTLSPPPLTLLNPLLHKHLPLKPPLFPIYVFVSSSSSLHGSSMFSQASGWWSLYFIPLVGYVIRSAHTFYTNINRLNNPAYFTQHARCLLNSQGISLQLIEGVWIPSKENMTIKLDWWIDWLSMALCWLWHTNILRLWWSLWENDNKSWNAFR